MKLLLFTSGALGLLIAGLPGTALGEAKPTPVPVEQNFKSAFINDPNFGKDPFFPNSSRRPLPVTNMVVDVTPPPLPTVPDDIFLKGINILKDRRLAIINNYTVAQGEEFELKLKGKTYRVRCVEVKDHSVVIQIGGAGKELLLRRGI